MDDFTLVYSYSRAQAIADGVLIDLTPMAQSYGFKLPLVISAALYHQYVMPPLGLEGHGQSLEGRLHDVLTLAMAAARNSPGEDRAYFRVALVMRPDKTETITVVLHVGPDDQGKPALTLCLPEDL